MVAAVTAAGGMITALAGTVLVRLTLTGTYARYVRVGMGPWLAVAGALLVILGAVTVVRAWRGGPHEGDGADAGGHDHTHVPAVGWLLLAPIAALLLVAPPTLGSFGVGRGTTVDVRAGATTFDPLPPGPDPVPMTLLEYGQRAFDHRGASLAGVSVQLTGFVSKRSAGGFELARYQIACCAADASAVIVRVVGIDGAAPRQDAWVTVTGTVQPAGGETPRLNALSVVAVAAPEDPYE
jgi:uncharacterized repeat protein (TIGR03943 family)